MQSLAPSDALSVERAVFYAAADAVFRGIMRNQVEMRNRPTETPAFEVAERDRITTLETRCALDRLIEALNKWHIASGDVLYSVNREAGRFKVGDRVRIARVLDTMTAPELVGQTGEVIEVEQPSQLQRNYEVRLDDTGSEHYLNDQMLEAVTAPFDTTEYLAQCISCYLGQHDECDPKIARGDEELVACRCHERGHKPAHA